MDEVLPMLQQIPSREPAVLMSILGTTLLICAVSGGLFALGLYRMLTSVPNSSRLPYNLHLYCVGGDVKNTAQSNHE